MSVQKCEFETIMRVVYGLDDILSLPSVSIEQFTILKDRAKYSLIEKWLESHPEDIQSVGHLLVDRHSSSRDDTAVAWFAQLSDEQASRYPKMVNEARFLAFSKENKMRFINRIVELGKGTHTKLRELSFSECVFDYLVSAKAWEPLALFFRHDVISKDEFVETVEKVNGLCQSHVIDVVEQLVVMEEDRFNSHYNVIDKLPNGLVHLNTLLPSLTQPKQVELVSSFHNHIEIDMLDALHPLAQYELLKKDSKFIELHKKRPLSQLEYAISFQHHLESLLLSEVDVSENDMVRAVERNVQLMEALCKRGVSLSIDAIQRIIVIVESGQSSTVQTPTTTSFFKLFDASKAVGDKSTILKMLEVFPHNIILLDNADDDMWVTALENGARAFEQHPDFPNFSESIWDVVIKRRCYDAENHPQHDSFLEGVGNGVINHEWIERCLSLNTSSILLFCDSMTEEQFIKVVSAKPSYLNDDFMEAHQTPAICKAAVLNDPSLLDGSFITSLNSRCRVKFYDPSMDEILDEYAKDMKPSELRAYSDEILIQMAERRPDGIRYLENISSEVALSLIPLAPTARQKERLLGVLTA
jgi:hypothetical protein